LRDHIFSRYLVELRIVTVDGQTDARRIPPYSIASRRKMVIGWRKIVTLLL